MVTIVYAHPLEDSLNACILQEIEKTCKHREANYKILNLYRDGFNPVLTEQERAAFFTGGVTQDALVKAYQQVLQATSHLIFVFPIWWNEQPAIVKGFIERVCLPNFAYHYTATGLAPLLTHIQKVTVLTTSGSTTEALKQRSGNSIENQFIKNIIKPMTGLEKADWVNFGLAGASSEQIKQYLSEIKNHI